jgi:OmpA-OmpF porin, OOP family
MKNFFLISLYLVIAFFGNSSAYAQADQGKVHHSLISGPVGYDFDDVTRVTEYGTFEKGFGGSRGEFFCKGKNRCTDGVPGFKDGKFVAEGKITKVSYRNDKNPAGALAILRSYENTVKQLGGIKLTYEDAPAMGDHMFYVDKAKTWILLHNLNNQVYLSILEGKNFEQLVTAGQLSEQINQQGFVNLNVNFDTNKALIKESDKPTINEVVTLLKNDTNLKLSVEGHTDNVGNAAANKTLSQARSDSLVAYMTAAGIPANRLVSKGFGSESPVSDNRTDEGRAKNRRVELVKIK